MAWHGTGDERAGKGRQDATTFECVAGERGGRLPEQVEPFQRVELALLAEPLIAAMARERMLSGKPSNPVPKSAQGSQPKAEVLPAPRSREHCADIFTKSPNPPKNSAEGKAVWRPSGSTSDEAGAVAQADATRGSEVPPSGVAMLDREVLDREVTGDRANLTAKGRQKIVICPPIAHRGKSNSRILNESGSFTLWRRRELNPRPKTPIAEVLQA